MHVRCHESQVSTRTCSNQNVAGLHVINQRSELLAFNSTQMQILPRPRTQFGLCHALPRVPAHITTRRHGKDGPACSYTYTLLHIALTDNPACVIVLKRVVILALDNHFALGDPAWRPISLRCALLRCRADELMPWRANIRNRVAWLAAGL